jgi:hypothetical protein
MLLQGVVHCVVQSLTDVFAMQDVLMLLIAIL